MTQNEIIQFLENEFKSQLKKAAKSKPADRDEIRLLYMWKGVSILFNLDRAIPFYEAWFEDFLPEKSSVSWSDLNSRVHKGYRSLTDTEVDTLLVDITKTNLSKFASLVTKRVTATPRALINFVRSIKLPISISGMINLGLVISQYYLYLASRMPHSVNLKVDILCDQLAEKLVYKVVMIEDQGRDIDRTRKAARLKQKAKSQRKQIVLDCYYRIPNITRDTKPFTAARITHETLQSRIQNPPSIKTIMRYLREEKAV